MTAACILNSFQQVVEERMRLFSKVKPGAAFITEVSDTVGKQQQADAQRAKEAEARAEEQRNELVGHTELLQRHADHLLPSGGHQRTYPAISAHSDVFQASFSSLHRS